MWIYLNNSFLSIVQNREDAALLHVRARKKGDIEAVFPDAKVTATPFGDYTFRADLPRAEVADALVKQAMTLTYSNFKNSVKDRQRQDVYMDIWSASHELAREPGKPMHWGVSERGWDDGEVARL